MNILILGALAALVLAASAAMADSDHSITSVSPSGVTEETARAPDPEVIEVPKAEPVGYRLKTRYWYDDDDTIEKFTQLKILGRVKCPSQYKNWGFCRKLEFSAGGPKSYILEINGIVPYRYEYETGPKEVEINFPSLILPARIGDFRSKIVWNEIFGKIRYTHSVSGWQNFAMPDGSLCRSLVLQATRHALDSTIPDDVAVRLYCPRYGIVVKYDEKGANQRLKERNLHIRLENFGVPPAGGS